MKLKLLFVLFLFTGQYGFGQRPMEYLDRSVVPLEIQNGVFLTWRMLGTDPANVAFNLYRNGEKINDLPIDGATNYTDASGIATDKYAVEVLVGDASQGTSKEFQVWPLQDPVEKYASKAKLAFKRIPLPEAPMNEESSYFAGDMSVGDLDGNGDYELIYEWEGYCPHIDAIDLSGNLLWRINLGPNVTYNACGIMVYDLNGDGKAEVALSTGPGTIDGTGNYLSKGPAASDNDLDTLKRVNISGEETTSGNLVEDPQYISVFDGETGKELSTINFWPQIGTVTDWEDSYGKRSGSIKAAVLYDKNLGPLLVYSRGIYSRIAMGAYTWNGSELQSVWKFDSGFEDDTENECYGYRGMGNHSVTVGDVDNDGSDELMYGACAIDNDGTGLYTTGRGHGDTHALGDLIPDRPGLEYFQPHENKTYGFSMRDAATGEIIWEVLSANDVGRAWAADVDSRYPGAEVSAIGYGNYNCNGEAIETDYNAYYQPLYFDGDVQRELRNRNTVNNVTDGTGSRLLTAYYYGAATIHSSKHDANLVADILGDWREEIILPNGAGTELLVFSSWFPTERKNFTLMHDPTYRMQVATQNIGYNQPANVSYYFPAGAPVLDIQLIKYDPNGQLPTGTTDVNQSFSAMIALPNPTMDLVNVSLLNDQEKVIELYNLGGTKLSATISSDQLTKISMKQMPTGVYLLRVVIAGDVYTQKIIKK